MRTGSARGVEGALSPHVERRQVVEKRTVWPPVINTGKEPVLFLLVLDGGEELVTSRNVWDTVPAPPTTCDLEVLDARDAAGRRRCLGARAVGK